MPCLGWWPRSQGTDRPRSRRRSCRGTREPMIDEWVSPPPTCNTPRACNTAMRAVVPVPVGERSERPGDTMHVLRALTRFPSRVSGPANCTIDTFCDVGQFGMRDRVLLASCNTDLLAEHRQLAGFVGNDLEAECGGVDDGVDHPAIGDVDRDRRSIPPSPAWHRARRRTPARSSTSPTRTCRRGTRRRCRRARPACRGGTWSPVRPSGSTPVSSNTVAMHIVLEPDIGGYSVGSITIAPAAQSSRVEGTIRLTWRATEPRGSQINRRRMSSWSRSNASFFVHHRVAGRWEHPAGDHIALLTFGMAADDRDDPFRHHRAVSAPVSASCRAQPSSPSRSWEPNTTRLFVAT